MKKKFIAVFSLFLAETSLLSGCDMLFNSLSAEEKALKEKYSAVYADVSQEMLAIASAKTGVAATAMKEDAQSSHVASTGAFVYFISELYKSDAFIVSEAPVTFTCTYQEYQEEYLLGMYTALDETAGSVLGEIYVETKNVTSGEKGYGYIYIEVGYDFKAEKIIDFDLYMCDWATGEHVMRSLYQDEVLYTLEAMEDEAYQEAKEKVVGEMTEFAEVMQTAVELDHDFTKEYTASMQALF